MLYYDFGFGKEKYVVCFCKVFKSYVNEVGSGFKFFFVYFKIKGYIKYFVC